MATDGKIQDLQQLAQSLANNRNGHKVVHCHGVFDLLHIGHIKHLEQARQLGDILVVTITPDRFVNKGPSRPAFGQQLRAQALASLSCVDYVAINHWPHAHQTIRTLRPNIFVKGTEFKQLKDHSGAVADEAAAVREIGGDIAFTGDVVFSSSNLINRYLNDFPQPVRNYLADFAERHPLDTVLQTLNATAKMNVTVVGEAIIDEYCYCDAIGKSSKEPMLAVKQQSVETFAGGTLAVANHIAPFVNTVNLVSAIGPDCPRHEFIHNALAENITPHWVHASDIPTIVKRRFVDRYFFQKLFSVYEMNDTPIASQTQNALLENLDNTLPHSDLVVVVDFGHGLITPAAIQRINQKSRFLLVNAQSNAGNLGYHTISRYPHADVACITENELRLEARDRDGDLRPLLKNLAEKLDTQLAIATRGAKGCLLYSENDQFVEVPALAGHVRDRMGAGDTFLSIAALAAVQNVSTQIVGLLGNAAAAQAVATVGHRQALEKPALIKHVECLLK